MKSAQNNYPVKAIVLLLCLFTHLSANAQAQYSSDLGAPAASTLQWDHISSIVAANASIGLTIDRRIYTWGDNESYTIHTRQYGKVTKQAQAQAAPYYVAAPAGETPKKVRLASNNMLGIYLPTYFCLMESGRLYAWGINGGTSGGLAGTNWPSVGTTIPASDDTTKTRRSPVQLTILGETSFVDYDVAGNWNYWIAIGASGKAYHIGYNEGWTTNNSSTFTALPNPAGAGSSFKYTRVWVSNIAGEMSVYLKGNDGNIYFTGRMSNAGAAGVPSIYTNANNVPTPTLTANENAGLILSIAPRLVPFPAGEDIVDMYVRQSSQQDANYAISASGKAYIAGLWRVRRLSSGLTDYLTYVVAPLKNPPAPSVLDSYVYSGSDSLYVLKQFTEIAMPPGVTKVLSIMGTQELTPRVWGTMLVGDNNRVYWSGGAGYDEQWNKGNYLTISNSASELPDRCTFVMNAHSNSYYSWLYEAINYRGAAKLFRPHISQQLGIISQSGRGYFVGKLWLNTGTGKNSKLSTVATEIVPFPVPIANELLLDCNSSPGTGGNGLGTTTTVTSATGTIDCGKTQLVPAPVQGTPRQTGLIVTITVSATGTFPVSVTGSGMSLANGLTAITALSTGTQQFYIPLQYDGSTLGTLNFTIGTASNAGNCSANLSSPPKQAITNVWTLDCVPTLGPPLK